jgi:type II secretory pathway component PulJ
MRYVISGTEGSGKSTTVFARLSEITTVERPVLFAVKNYALMKLQIASWLERADLRYLDLKESEFAIAGCNQTYPQALEAYTNKQNPKVIGKDVRFIFTTQAQLQRLGHLRFIREDTLKPIIYSHIVVDEFSPDSGIIPYGLDCALNGDPAMSSREKIEWVRKNYTIYDKEAVEQALYAGKSGYFMAYWIETCPCPITFLTSEKLAVALLTSIGFEEEKIESPDYSHCVVNIWSHKNITRDFLKELNDVELNMWKEISQNYNVIISDQINKWMTEKEEESLEVRVFSHMAIRGRNDLINSKILTILTHIPQSYILGLQVVLNQFSEKEYSYEEVESLFYRDRFMQDVGRVIGHRGSTETDVIMHESLVKTLKDIPYTLNTDWSFDISNLDIVLSKVDEIKATKKEIKNGKKIKRVPISDYTFLDHYFEISEDSILTTKEIKEITAKILEKHTNDLAVRGIFSPVPAAKVATYFGLQKPKNKRVNGKSTKVVVGLKITAKYIILKAQP